MMNNRFFILFLILMVLIPRHVFAQECGLNPEVINKLYLPTLGAYSVWDGISGLQDMDEGFVYGAVLPSSGHVIVAGERYAKDGKVPKLTVTEIDRRGRVSWEKEHEIKNLKSVSKIIVQDEKILVLAEVTEGQRRSAVWIGFFDLAGELKSHNVVRKSQASLHGRDLLMLPKGQMLLAASVFENGDNAAEYSELYRLNNKAKMVSMRAYQPGPNNRIANLSPMNDGRFIASGFLEDASKRRAGWIMIVEQDGSVVWQRQYPRGAGAQFEQAVPFAKDYIALVGTAYPAVQGGETAGWLMVVEARNGIVAWQRYYTGDYDYVGRGLMVSEQGLISLLLDGDPPKSSKSKAFDGTLEMQRGDYVRILTLNPRGVIFDSQEFFNGEGTDAMQLLRGPSDERIIVGRSDMSYLIEKAAEGDDPKEEELKYSQDGWILASPAMASYEDPCAPKAYRVPDDR